MKGTTQDFLKLVAEDSELARRLGQLALEFDFEFSNEELSEADLEAVAGGTTPSDPSQTSLLSIQDAISAQSKIIQVMSNILKSADESEDSTIDNIR